MMRVLWRILKWVGIVIGVFILLVGIYLLAAIGLPKISTRVESPRVNEIGIYILSNGVHTDIVVPVKSDVVDWSSTVKFKNTLANDTLAQLVAFGWGDKGFYLDTPTWADLKFSTGFKAAFGLSHSALHATFYRGLKTGESCRSIHISRKQYERLVSYIKKSFLTDSSGNVIYIPTNAVYGKNDAFYEGVGSYSLFHTCNTWANNGLKACGQKACLWTPFDKGIFALYK